MIKLTTMAIIALMTGTVGLKAQSTRYASAMKANFDILHKATSMQDFNSVSAAFNRIATAEKTLWIPYYYAALAKLSGAMHSGDVDKDQIGTEVDSLLAKAELIEKNSELSTLHYYSEVPKLSVNPAQRYMKVAPLMEKYYQTALAQDSTNPRIYFMRGETVFHTPESFGGGKAAAKPIFQKAVDLFAAQIRSDDFKPRWGKEEAEAMLEQCK